MRMIFSIPKPKPQPQSQIHRTIHSTSNQHINNESLVISHSFHNIFSRLQSSGKCSSCGN